jgi:hypothetical protein
MSPFWLFGSSDVPFLALMMFAYRPRFSLIGLGAIVGLVALLCAALHYQIQGIKTDAARERVAITKLRALGCGYFSTQRDYGFFFNSLVSDADRERIYLVLASGQSTRPDEYERELIAAISALKGIQAVSFHRPTLRGAQAEEVDVDAIGKKLGVVVGFRS